MIEILFNCFPQGKAGALTFSYDDGVTQDRRLVEIFNKHGMKGSFHLNAKFLSDGGRHLDRDEVADLFSGHEISCHSYTHPFLDHQPQAAVIQQMLRDREALEALAGYPVRGMSYPYGTTNNTVVETLRVLDFAYARTTRATGAFDLPEDFLRWHPSCHHNHNLQELGERFKAQVEKDYQPRLHLLYVWGHSYEFDNQDNWEVIENFCAALAGNPNIWMATNLEIVQYVQAQHRLEFAADCSLVRNPSAISVWLTANGKIVEIPPGAMVHF